MVPPRFTFSILIEGSEVKPKQLSTGGTDQPDFAGSSALSGVFQSFLWFTWRQERLPAKSLQRSRLFEHKEAAIGSPGRGVLLGADR